jgi:uncharacterized protein YecE (DUF72 family)
MLDPIRTPDPAATTIAYVTRKGYVDLVSLHIGTSGWAYKEWKPAFYPADVPPDRFLEHYGSVLSGCEINATFYRLQSGPVVSRWAGAVPAGFRFAVKAHRRLTHARQMAWDEAEREFLRQFLESIAPLGDRFGALLLQYPPTRQRDDDGLAVVLDALPTGVAFAMEFRHDSWINASVFAAIAARGGTVCMSETAGKVLDRLPPGPFAYVRLRSDRYSAKARDGWLALLRREAAQRPVLAFAKHEGIPAGDPFGGIGLAEWLMAKQIGGA